MQRPKAKGPAMLFRDGCCWFPPFQALGCRVSKYADTGSSRRLVVAAAKKGFGERRRNVVQKTSNPKDAGDGWLYAANAADFEDSKPTKAITLETGKMVVVYKVGDDFYSSDVNSTAFEFPLVDAKIFDGPDGPAIECPFDGTTYDLVTGKVIEWCPSNNPIRSVLGMLKSKSEPENLAVHEVSLGESGDIFVRMENA